MFQVSRLVSEGETVPFVKKESLASSALSKRGMGLFEGGGGKEGMWLEIRVVGCYSVYTHSVSYQVVAWKTKFEFLNRPDFQIICILDKRKWKKVLGRLNNIVFRFGVYRR